jgi:hypothetical protein
MARRTPTAIDAAALGVGRASRGPHQFALVIAARYAQEKRKRHRIASPAERDLSAMRERRILFPLYPTRERE